MSLVLFDDTTNGLRLRFAGPETIITVQEPSDIAAALEAIALALARGRYVAGYFAYELGYALEPRLAPLLTKACAQPLLWFGVFGPPEQSAVPDHLGRAYAGPLRLEWDQAAYDARFARVKSYIAAGDIYQANLSFRADFAFVGDARALYENLLKHSGAAHCAFVDDGVRRILSLSPELFFDLSAQGALTARPMKGTSPRHGDDDAERAALAASIKDRAENLMIVDLTRNDLGRIAETGSVVVNNLFAVETYPMLHTMVSTVTAQLRPATPVSRIVEALFPCGSITGAPKMRAMEIIHELETSPRGVYCGAVGFFTPVGVARFNVAIRTITIASGRGTLGIGGAVVADLDSADEYAECLLKARFFTTTRRPLALIETLRFENNFVRLPYHLARLAESAATFGITFDADAARAALKRAVAGNSGPLRVRLTLDEAGEFAVTAAALPQTREPWTYAFAPLQVLAADALARHKTDWRELYERAIPSVDEAIFINERGELVEGMRTNIFIKREEKLLTPPLASGALAGCLRAELLTEGKAVEAVLYPADLKGAEIFLGNSLRGLVRAVPAVL